MAKIHLSYNNSYIATCISLAPVLIKAPSSSISFSYKSSNVLSSVTSFLYKVPETKLVSSIFVPFLYIKPVCSLFITKFLVPLEPI